MNYYERVGNMHLHSTYSDGWGSPQEIAEAASRAGLDFLVLTDHNAWPHQHEGWYNDLLLLVGEEIHDPGYSHHNHFLALNAQRDLAEFAGRTQQLVDALAEVGGLGFLAHPNEHSGIFTSEPEINWDDWEVRGYTGIELWNYMSEFKSHLDAVPRALLYAFFPKLAITGPFRETLALWDELLAQGRVVAIGGSDAHATTYRLGPIKRQVFPYEYLFRMVNTHVLVDAPWSKDVSTDGSLIYAALAAGRAFVAYDGLYPTTGFTFEASDGRQTFTIGDELPAGPTYRFVARTPAKARLQLVHNGFVVAETVGEELHHTSRTPGYYRVQALRSYRGRERGWIYANPIYVAGGYRRQPTPQS